MKRYIELDHIEVVQALKDYIAKHYNLQVTGHPVLLELEARRLGMPEDALGAIRIEVKS